MAALLLYDAAPRLQVSEEAQFDEISETQVENAGCCPQWRPCSCTLPRSTAGEKEARM